MGTTSRDTAHGSACCSRPSHPPSPSAHSSSSAGQLPGRSHACSRGSWTLRPVRSKDRRRGRAAPQLAGRPFNRRWKPSPQAYPALGASYCPTASTLCMRSSCSWGSGPGCTAGRGPARLSVTSTRSLQRGQRGGGGGGGGRALLLISTVQHRCALSLGCNSLQQTSRATACTGGMARWLAATHTVKRGNAPGAPHCCGIATRRALPTSNVSNHCKGRGRPGKDKSSNPCFVTRCDL